MNMTFECLGQLLEEFLKYISSWACHVTVIGRVVYTKIFILEDFENISASFSYFFIKYF